MLFLNQDGVYEDSQVARALLQVAFCKDTSGESRHNNNFGPFYLLPRVQPHTDESLGDCSFLNTCFHMDTCKYIHYEVDKTDVKLARKRESAGGGGMSVGLLESTKLIPPQWIQCDLRNLNVSVLLPVQRLCLES